MAAEGEEGGPKKPVVLIITGNSNTGGFMHAWMLCTPAIDGTHAG